MSNSRINIIIISCILPAVLISCDGSPQKPDDDNNRVHLTYYPLAIGSTWQYKGFNTRDTFEFQINIVSDTIIKSKSYSVLFNSYEERNHYYRQSGGSIFRYVFDKVDLPYEGKFLDTNLAVGSKWEYAARTNSGYYLFRYTILQKDTTLILSAFTFDNVIGIRREQLTITLSDTLPFEVNDYYYSYGIGLVYNKRHGSGEFELIGYDLK